MRYHSKLDLAKQIIKSLETTPEKWRFTDYNAVYGDFSMWIANRPYHDLYLGDMGNGFRIPFWYRGKIRKLMDHIMITRHLNTLN